MKKSFLLKFFLSPLFAGFFVVILMAAYYVFCFLFSLKFGFFDVEETGITETLTYLFYGFSLGVFCCLIKDFLNTKRQNTFFAIIFLWFAALFREMGIQHWLTTHDSAVTKTRFFLNPNNPLYEKIISGFLILFVMAILIWLLCKYFKKIVYGFLKFQTISWTFVFFSMLVLMTQIADRLPANYLKASGANLADWIIFVLKIFEEGGESLLPLIFTIALLQYHFILHKNL